MRGLGAAESLPAAVAHQAPALPGQHFTYGAEALAVAGNGQAPAQFQVQNQDFEADFLTANSDGPFTVMIQIGNRYLSNIPIHSANIFGTGSNPMPLLPSLRLRKSDIVILTVKDLSGNPNNVRIGFIGRQLG